MTPESRVRNEICSWLQSRHVVLFIHDSMGVFDPTKKIYRANKNPYRRKGVSDILGVLPGGRFLGVEVKTPEQKDLFGKRTQSKGYLSAEQKEFIEDVERQGGVAFVARSIADAESELLKRGIVLTRGALTDEATTMKRVFVAVEYFLNSLAAAGLKQFGVVQAHAAGNFEVRVTLQPRMEMNS